MKTILFLETRMGVGGSERIWTDLIFRLDRRRFRPILCCIYEAGHLGERLRQAGVPVYLGLARNRWDIRVFPNLVRLLQKEEVDVLYMMNQPLTQFWGTFCGKLAGTPVLMTSVHSTGRVNRILRGQWIDWLTLPFIDCVTALSETHKNYLIRKEWIDPTKIEVIPNGVEMNQSVTQAPKPIDRKSLGLVNGEAVVGIVAMLRPEKAHEVFLDAARRVLHAIPRVRFLVIGEGPERPRLEKLVEELGIKQHVSFLGLREDIPEIVKIFDVATLSSMTEALPASVLEYLAAGKPVVATRVGSLPELIEEGKSGFLVNPGDAQALAARIIELLCNPQLAREMGARGRETVIERYSVERMVNQMEDLFERLLERRGKP